MFLGLSTIHSSEVPLVLNLQTGSITSQYHVVIDDCFSTLESIGQDDDPPDHWDHLCLETPCTSQTNVMLMHQCICKMTGLPLLNKNKNSEMFNDNNTYIRHLLQCVLGQSWILPKF